MKAERPEQNGQEHLPALGGAQIILVVPFYNEEKTLPTFIDSLKTNKSDSSKLYIVGVNHRSKDDSEGVLKAAAHGYAVTGIVHEGQEIASVGIPRQKGIKTAFELATQSVGQQVVIGSIDTDSTVSDQFLVEADVFLNSERDFLLFPTRNDQDQFLACIDTQADSESASSAARTLVGIDWLKYQLRAFLLRAGAIETRGSGGYFFTTEGYAKAHGHKPVYSAEGTIVTGESNAIGIRAKRNGASATVSQYYKTASPRRIFKSLRNSTERYTASKSGLSFEAIGNDQSLPILSKGEWEKGFQTMLYGAVRTFAIKSLAYDVISGVLPTITISGFAELMESMHELYLKTDFEGDERDAIGSKTYISIFEQAFNSLGEIKQDVLLEGFRNAIPTDKELVDWAKNTSPIIPPVERL